MPKHNGIITYNANTFMIIFTWSFDIILFVVGVKMLQIFLKSLLIGYSGAVMPGSLLTYTIDKSLKNGPKSGLLISIGHVLLELILVFLALFGLGKYLGSKTAQMIIGIAGGFVLILFSIQMLRDVYRQKIKLDLDEGSSRQGNLILGGAVISASNPYFTFWWAVVGLGLIMESYNRFGIAGVTAFYIGHILSDISWFGFISLIVSKTKHLISLRLYKGIIIFLGLCLTAFGISFIYSGILKIIAG